MTWKLWDMMFQCSNMWHVNVEEGRLRKHHETSTAESCRNATGCHGEMSHSIPIHHIHDLQFIQIWTLISTSVSISFVKSAHTSNSLLGGVFQRWVFPKIGGVPPNHPWINRVFHYKPSIFGVHSTEAPWTSSVKEERNNRHGPTLVNLRRLRSWHKINQYVYVYIYKILWLGL